MIVAVALMIAVLGNGYAVAVIGGIILTLLVARRLVAWIPSLIPAVLAYGIWWLTYRDDIKPKPELKPSKILDIPWGAFRVVRTAVEAATGFPTWLAAIAVLGLLAWIVVLAVRRRFDLFDWIILATLAIGLCLLVVQRISIDDEAAPACATATRSASCWRSPWSPTFGCPRRCSCGASSSWPAAG